MGGRVSARQPAVQRHHPGFRAKPKKASRNTADASPGESESVETGKIEAAAFAPHQQEGDHISTDPAWAIKK